MTAMAHRRPITSHPLFVPLIAGWSAALLGLTIAVLPASAVERGLAGLGLSGLVPLTSAGRIAASIVAAAIGALAGYALARGFSRRVGDDPRPIYAEMEAERDEPSGRAPVRRPLRVREELADGFGDESQVIDQQSPAPLTSEPSDPLPQEREGFMILTPQPIHPPRPAPELEALLEQFDSAFAAFSAGDTSPRAEAGVEHGPDPVRAFVARQTQAAPAASSMGGLVPDHQAELRAALDKLARSQRKQ